MAPHAETLPENVQMRSACPPNPPQMHKPRRGGGHCCSTLHHATWNVAFCSNTCLFLHIQRLEKTQPTSARNQSKSNQLICTHPQIQTTPHRAAARERDAAPEAQAAAVTAMTRGRHFPSPPSVSQSSTGDFSRQHPDTRRTPSRTPPPPGFQPAAEREQNKSNYRCARAPLPGESSARCTGEPQLLQAGLTQPSTPRFILFFC